MQKKFLGGGHEGREGGDIDLFSTLTRDSLLEERVIEQLLTVTVSSANNGRDRS